MSSLSLDRLLSYAEDSAAASGDDGSFVLAVRQDTLASSTSADGDYAAFKVNSVGSLYTNDSAGNALLTTIDADTGTISTTLTDFSKAEDAAHVSGDKGIMALAVRNDAGTALAGTDGDYIPLSTDSTGNLRVAASFSAPNSAIASVAVTVGTTEVALPGSALSGRDEVTIQNLGSQSIFIGPTGVTTASGLEISKKSNMTIQLGPSVSVFGISGTAGQNVRVFEVA
jgi:hypothetical protein